MLCVISYILKKTNYTKGVNLMSDFSDRLKNLRDSKGWTKTYVANHLGIKMQTYANYEYGLREPDLKLTNNIAKLYGVTSDYLISGEENSSDTKTADLADKDTVFTYEGRQIPPEDLEYMKRLLRGGK